MLAFEDASMSMQEDSITIFKKMLSKVGNIVEIRKVRMGRAYHDIPFLLKTKRRRYAALNMFLDSVRDNKLRVSVEEKIKTEFCHIFMGLTTKCVARNKQINKIAGEKGVSTVLHFRW